MIKKMNSSLSLDLKPLCIMHVYEVCVGKGKGKGGGAFSHFHINHNPSRQWIGFLIWIWATISSCLWERWNCSSPILISVGFPHNERFWHWYRIITKAPLSPSLGLLLWPGQYFGTTAPSTGGKRQCTTRSFNPASKQDETFQVWLHPDQLEGALDA